MIHLCVSWSFVFLTQPWVYTTNTKLKCAYITRYLLSAQPQWLPAGLGRKVRGFIGDFKSYPALQHPPPTPVPSGPPPALFLVLQMLQGIVVHPPECFPGGSDSKPSPYNAGDPGSIPGAGRSPGEGNGNPLQYSCLENPMDRGAW